MRREEGYWSEHVALVEYIAQHFILDQFLEYNFRMCLKWLNHFELIFMCVATRSVSLPFYRSNDGEFVTACIYYLRNLLSKRSKWKMKRSASIWTYRQRYQKPRLMHFNGSKYFKDGQWQKGRKSVVANICVRIEWIYAWVIESRVSLRCTYFHYSLLCFFLPFSIPLNSFVSRSLSLYCVSSLTMASSMCCAQKGNRERARFYVLSRSLGARSFLLFVLLEKNGSGDTTTTTATTKKCTQPKTTTIRNSFVTREHLRHT